EALVPARHARSGNAFAYAVEPEIIRILVVERTGEVSRLLLQRDCVGSVAFAFQSVASRAVDGVNTATGVCRCIGIGVNRAARENRLVLFRRLHEFVYGSLIAQTLNI